MKKSFGAMTTKTKFGWHDVADKFPQWEVRDPNVVATLFF
jgi:hypothetical protein